MLQPLVITLDGPAGSGKSSAARQLADRLGVSFLDTGAMYRAIAARTLEAGVDPGEEPERAADLATRTHIDFDDRDDPPRISVDGVDLTARIRQPAVTRQVSAVAKVPGVRSALVAAQRRIASERAVMVTEGRDQGSVVFPNAALKFYLDANPAERARRRGEELAEQGESVDLASLQAEIIARDEADRQRPDGPLVCPSDAIVLDTTALALDDVVELLARRCRASLGASLRRLQWLASGEELRPGGGSLGSGVGLPC